MRGFARVLEGLGAFEGGMGGMGHDFPEKWTNFLNRPVASTSLVCVFGNIYCLFSSLLNVHCFPFIALCLCSPTPIQSILTEGGQKYN